jgi:hypothetical protein
MKIKRKTNEMCSLMTLNFVSDGTFSSAGDNATEMQSIQGISDKGGHILLSINTNKKVKLVPQDSLFSRMRFSDEKGTIARNSRRRTLRAPVVNVCMCKR